MNLAVWNIGYIVFLWSCVILQYITTLMFIYVNINTKIIEIIERNRHICTLQLYFQCILQVLALIHNFVRNRHFHLEFHCDPRAGLLQSVCAGSIKYNFVGVSNRHDDETAQQTTRRMNVRNLDKCKKLRFSTCLMLAGKRLSSRTEIWQRTIRQYLIAPSAGMNYSSANNGAWCTKRHTQRRNSTLPLSYAAFPHVRLYRGEVYVE